MENSMYELASQVANLVSSVKAGNELGMRKSVVLSKEIIYKYQLRSYNKMQINLVFKELIHFVSTDADVDASLRNKCMTLLREIFGDDHHVLSEIYYTLSTMKLKENKLEEAVEYGGRALLIRVNCFGVMHAKTAESHFNMGIMYKMLGEFDKARREISISRGIKIRLHGSISPEVSNCDFELARIEMNAGIPENVYLPLLKCYRARYLSLGSSDASTITAFDMMNSYRSITGERLITGYELKDRVQELNWQEAETHSLEYSISIFVARLGTDEVLKLQHLKALICSASNFSMARLANERAQQVSLKDSIDSYCQLLLTPARPVQDFDEMLLSPIDESKQSTSSTAEFAHFGADVKFNTSSTSAGVNISTSVDHIDSSLFLGDFDSVTSKVLENSSLTSSLKTRKPFSSNSSHTSGQSSKPARVLFSGDNGNASVDPSVSNANNVIPHYSREIADNAMAASSKTLQQAVRAAMAMLPSNNTGISYGGVSACTTDEISSLKPSVATHAPFQPNNDNHSNYIANGSTGGRVHLTTNRQLPNQIIATKQSIDDDAISVVSNRNTVPIAANSNSNSTPATIVGSRFEERSKLVSPNQSPQKQKSYNNSSASPSKNQNKTITFHSKSLDDCELKHNFSAIMDYKKRSNKQLYLVRNNRNLVRAALPFAMEKKNYVVCRDSAQQAVLVLPTTEDLYNMVSNSHKLKLSTKVNSSASSKSRRNEDVVPLSQLLHAMGISDSDNAGYGSNEGSKADDHASTNKAQASNALTAMLGKKTGGSSSNVTVGKNNNHNTASLMVPRRELNPPTPPPLPSTWPPVPHQSVVDKKAAKAHRSVFAIINNGGKEDPTEDGTDAEQETINAGPKLKQLYLEGLKAVEGTLWVDDSDPLPPTSMLFDDIEECFAVVTKNKLKPKQFMTDSAGASAGGPGNTKSALESIFSKAAVTKQETVLDPQRANNLNIMLAKFARRSVSEIVEAIINFDADALGLSAIMSLSQFIPTSDEVRKVRQYVIKKKENNANMSEKSDNNAGVNIGISKANAKAALSESDLNALMNMNGATLTELRVNKAEQYVFFLSKVSKLEDRLSAMGCWLTAKETCDNISRSANTIITASKEVRGSSRLKYILKAFLELSNKLSKYSKTTSVMSGFRLASLSKLVQTKCNDGITAEEYVVGKILVNFPEALDITADMPTVEAAKQVIFSRLNADIKKLQDGIQMMNYLLAIEENATTPQQPKNTKTIEQVTDCMKKMRDFSTKASKDLQEALTEYAELCKYFGEDTSKQPGTSNPVVDPEMLFGQLTAFVRSIGTVTEKVREKVKKRARLERTISGNN